MKNRLYTLISSIFAGLLIGLVSLLFILAKAYGGENGLLIGACFFPIGLIGICFGKLYLYTGKIGFILDKTINTRNLSKTEWIINIFIGNMLGAIIIGYIIYGFSQINLESSFTQAIKIIGLSKNIDFTFNSIFAVILQSFMCGILVYLAIRFFNNSNNIFLKILGIFVPIMLFVYFGFQHCIANITYLIASQNITISSCISLLLCIIGNSVGALFINYFIDKKGDYNEFRNLSKRENK